MGERHPAVESGNGTEALRAALKSQYHAALAMFREAIERCPDGLWSGSGHTNPFWRIAYHTLYFVHLYTQPRAAGFRAWELHQTGIQDLDDIPAPPELVDLVEPPHRPPQTGVPYTKAEILSYWGVCERMIDGALDAMDLNSPESGFPWYKVPKAEHQLISLRHVQHHTAQLSDRLRTATGAGVDWVGARRGAG